MAAGAGSVDVVALLLKSGSGLEAKDEVELVVWAMLVYWLLVLECGAARC